MRVKIRNKVQKVSGFQDHSCFKETKVDREGRRCARESKPNLCLRLLPFSLLPCPLSILRDSGFFDRTNGTREGRSQSQRKENLRYEERRIIVKGWRKRWNSIRKNHFVGAAKMLCSHVWVLIQFELSWLITELRPRVFANTCLLFESEVFSFL